MQYYKESGNYVARGTALPHELHQALLPVKMGSHDVRIWELSTFMLYVVLSIRKAVQVVSLFVPSIVA